MKESTVRRLLYLLLVLSHTPSQAPAASCPNANTLVDGETDSTAIVYDPECNPRTFQVVVSSTVERSLNLSNLNVMDVQSYPRVYQLLLNHNQLEKFNPINLDNDMESLELGNNFITDLSTCNFPRRLNYLDLSSNSFTRLSADTPWPDSGELQTLLLQGNSLHSVAPNTFAKLVSLQSLSLSNTGISNLDELYLPVSLRSLNATKNSITSASTKFTNLPTALQHLDLSNNLITEFPSVVSTLTTLVELNLESNGITEIHGISFASTLHTVLLANNPVSTIEICRADVSVFQNLAQFTAPSSVSTLCSNPNATSEEIQGVPFCIVEDHNCVILLPDSGSPPVADINQISGSSPCDSCAEVSNDSFHSIFSAETIGIIGGTFLIIGILLSALGFGIFWNKRQRTRQDVSPSRRAAMKINRERRLTSSAGNFVIFTNSGRTSRALGHGHDELRDHSDSKNENQSGSGLNTPSGAAAWGIYESPLEKCHPVALLEPSPREKGFHSASSASLQVRSKLKIKEDLEDLLVYEIPPEEIQMRRALHLASVKRSSKAALALSSVTARKKVNSALFLAEYQGYKVVIQALMRSKRRVEKRFIEQIRLAASLDHASIVHFIGVTTGCSTTASRQRGSSVSTAPSMYASSGLGTSSMTESMAKSRYPDMGAPSWHLGVVFEYMQHGSLATMFEVERHRREGKGFYPNNSVAAAIGSGMGNIFSWYPTFATSSANASANQNADWRCKLSIALDIAMGLVYLHANNYAHGRVCARKVLINEQGEAKLSVMDMLLPSDLTRKRDETQEGDFTGSLRDSAMWTMQKLTSRLGRPPKVPRRAGSGNYTHSRSASRNLSGHQVSEGGTLGRSRIENNSGESDFSGVSSVTMDDNNSPSGNSPALEEETDAFDENGLKKSQDMRASIVAAQREDVYAFGTFLWELDTMIAVEEENLGTSRTSTTGGTGNPRLLKFSPDCPMELQELARQCWHEVPSERLDAIDVQEELVRVLEGRLTANGQVPSNWPRPSHLSSLSSLSSSELSSNMSSARSALRVSVADL